MFHRGDEVVVEQTATWRDPATGLPGEPQAVASAFLVRHGRVKRVTRYPDLATSLAAAGLDESTEVRPRTPGPVGPPPPSDRDPSAVLSPGGAS